MDRLCVITLQGLGNSILAMPVLRALSFRYEVTAYVMANGVEELYRQFCPGIHVHTFSNNWRVLSQRMQVFDAAVSLYPNWKRELATLFRCDAKRKLSFLDPEYRFTSLVCWQTISRQPIHDLDNNFLAVSVLGGREEFPEFKQTVIERDSKRVSMHPTGSTPSKYYGIQFWVGLISWFQRDSWQIDLYFGSSQDERTFCANITKSLRDRGGITLHQGIDLKDVASTMLRSQLLIGSDSSLMHLAALFDIKTIGLWSYSDYRRIFPYGRDAQIYMPKEVLNAASFDRPRVRPPCLDRARFEDVIEIAHGARSPDLQIESRLKGNVGVFLF